MRKDFEMSEEDLETLLSAMKPVVPADSLDALIDAAMLAARIRDA